MKHRAGALVERCGDDGFDDKDGEERRFGSKLCPDDGCRDGCDGEEEREPTKPRVLELVGGFGPLVERFGMNANFEIFSGDWAEDGDVFAEVEPAAELSDGCVALGELRDGRGREEPCSKSVFSDAGAGERQEFEEAALSEEVEVSGIEAGMNVDAVPGLSGAWIAWVNPAIFDAGESFAIEVDGTFGARALA